MRGDPCGGGLDQREYGSLNVSKLNRYGHKEINVQIGRKTYKVMAIKSDVAAPILGWNFIKANRLNFVWNSWGDICIQDPKAKISQILNFKSMPHEDSMGQASLRLDIESGSDSFTQHDSLVAHDVFSLQYSVASMKALTPEAEQVNDLGKLPDSPYKELLKKYPEVLKVSFKEESSKTGILHRIHTTGPPCRGKMRRLLPGSPKAIEAKKAWDELIELGIVEPVDPATPNLFTSPLHFAPKPGGALRPVGDYRELNKMTQLDLYPLPNLRSFTQEISGSRIFSKMDLFFQ